jgi:hypothetical protein
VLPRVSLSFLICLLFGVVAGLRAQDEPVLKFYHPEKYERATKTDDKGLTQWDEHKPEKCPTCSGTGKAKCTTCVRMPEENTICPECKRNKDREVVCRACAGTGAMPDPLEKALCPACQAASFLLCMICHGGGQLKIDKAKQWSACPGCRSEGGYKCVVCNGTRLVEVAGVKPSLKDANAAALAKAIATTDQALRDLSAFSPAGGDKARKEVKTLAKILETAGSAHPSLKRTVKPLEDYMGKIFAGTNFQGHEEHEAEAMNLVKANSEYYLKHQKRMLELAHKRAEANEKLLAAQKGK